MVAVLTRLFGIHNLELAEDVMQEAFAKALKEWTFGIPSNPAGWLMLTAKNKAIDVIRRERYKKEFALETTALLRSEYTTSPVVEKLFMAYEIQDSQLRMIFACCHPALPPADQIALTLKTCSGFGTQEIAAALLTNSETIKKRLQRARNTITEENISFDIPIGEELKNRLNIVLQTIYLIFNEGYNSCNKEELIRKDLCEEAIRLALLLTENDYTNQSKCYSLVALMALLSSRFESRMDENGEIILLEDQDRSKWNNELINIGLSYLTRSAEGGEVSTYHIEAAIVAEHSMAKNFEETNWQTISALYNHLAHFNPSPSILLNKAIVTSKLMGPQTGIAEIMAIQNIDKLMDTQYLFAAVLGHLYKQAGDRGKAIALLNKAISLTSSVSEKKLLKRKLEAL
jgi:RNA polymerase sigma-70 factor (ECF subfamily)